MVTKTIVIAWLVQMMLTWSPPERRNSYIPDAREAVDAAKKRYEEIAEAILDVALDESNPTLVGGPKGRTQTAVLMASVAFFESGFRRDVHLGIGKLGRGDFGRSWCLMQLNIGTGKVPTNDPIIGSFTGKDLVADTHNCMKAGLHLMARSMRACRGLPWEYRLSAYTSGKCVDGEPKARARLSFGLRWVRQSPPQWTDKDLIQLWKGTKDVQARLEAGSARDGG